MRGSIRVLHVDDEAEFLEVAADFLQREDEQFEVITATTPSDGLARLAEDDVDCIVSDHEMPEMSGIELLKKVRDEFGDVPFILFTGKGSEEIASEAISAGVTDYLQKQPGTDQYTVLSNRIRNAVEGFRAQRAVEESERELRRIYERITDGFLVVDTEWRYTFVNEQGARLLDRSKSELVGERVWDVFPDLIGTSFEDALRTAMQTQETTSVEEYYPALDTWYDVRVYPADDGISVFFRGVTEQKETERDLELYETIVEALGDPVYALDAGGHYTFVNDAYVAETGYSREELLGTHVSKVLPEENLVRGRAVVRDLLEDDDRRSTTWEAKRLTADGERVPCEHHVALLPYGEDGKIQGTAGVIRDISDRKEHEERLEETTDRMQLALQGANSWVWDWNLETDMTTQSAVTGILGVEEDQVTRPIDDFIEELHPEDREGFLAAKNRAVTGDEGYHAEFRILQNDDVRWIESRGQVYQDDSGESNRLIGIATDVTGRKERALERQWMQRALDQSSEAVFVSDPETAQIEFVNDTACERLDYEREELLELTILDIQPDLSTIDEWQEHVARLRAEGHTLFEGTHVRGDGTRFPVEVNTGLVEIERHEYLLGIARDITHRKERERELQRQIERLDEFASIVSHDLRNPMNVAMGQLELAKAESDSERLDIIGRSLDRMETLIDDLLQLAREGETVVDAEPVDVADVVRDCWHTVDMANGELRIETETTVRADRTRLQQLLENLLRNAVQHGGDDVTVTVGSTDDGTGFYVADDGPGIPAGERDHVFETGYSTTDGGTGFGLSIVQKIAEAHGWDVSVTEGAEGGARFEISGARIPA